MKILQKIQTTSHHIPDYSNLHHCHKNLKSHVALLECSLFLGLADLLFVWLDCPTVISSPVLVLYFGQNFPFFRVPRLLIHFKCYLRHGTLLNCFSHFN
jgi:hypothetical protein